MTKYRPFSSELPPSYGPVCDSMTEAAIFCIKQKDDRYTTWNIEMLRDEDLSRLVKAEAAT